MEPFAYNPSDPTARDRNVSGTAMVDSQSPGTADRIATTLKAHDVSAKLAVRVRKTEIFKF